jgi:hypothetical protein
VTEPEPEVDIPPTDQPVAKTAGEEDHSDPDRFRGEDADPPTNP